MSSYPILSQTDSHLKGYFYTILTTTMSLWQLNSNWAPLPLGSLSHLFLLFLSQAASTFLMVVFGLTSDGGVTRVNLLSLSGRYENDSTLSLATRERVCSPCVGNLTSN